MTRVAGALAYSVGTRHRATLAAEALLDGQTEALTRKAIEAGLAGDNIALRLCMDRIVPPRKERPVCFALPALETADDAAAAMAAITEAVAQGELTPGEASELAKLVELFVKTVEAGEFDRRLKVLEDARESGQIKRGSRRIGAQNDSPGVSATDPGALFKGMTS